LKPRCIGNSRVLQGIRTPLPAPCVAEPLLFGLASN
jgi:hypothetical protein